jgi:hypothetical protein
MNLSWQRLMALLMVLTITVLLLTSCGNPTALMMSGGGFVISQNTYSKVYNGADALTVITTKRSIKEHAVDKVKKLND